MNNSIHTITANDTDTGQRLDRFLADKCASMSRSRLQTLIAQECVTCNGQTVTDASYKVRTGQSFLVTVPDIEPSHIVPQDIALDIVYEDDDLLVINKPVGLTVHPAPGHADNTLVNALLAHCGDSLSGIGGVARPGIVHRIDKDTSGLLVVAKHDTAHIHLSEQLAKRTLKRTYQAVVWGGPSPAHSHITGNIGRSLANRQKMTVRKTGGKPAVTHYRTLQHFAIAAHMECQLETGRTHQIRVHFTHIGHPIIGDQTYGQSTQSRLKANQFKSLADDVKTTFLAFNRQALHAYKLVLIHPVCGQEMTFTCPLPEDMQMLIETLESTA